MNIPPSKLDNAQTIMAVGIGGGFDVFTTLPFVHHWPDKKFVLVNSSAEDDYLFQESTEHNYPQGMISDKPNVLNNYTVGRHGTKALKSAYQAIADMNGVDCILAVDGGVDSLARGDEESNGTVLEDFIGIAALDEIRLPKVLCCAGFGCETEENMNHYRILENMASLAEQDAFLGSFSLTKHMPEFSLYREECDRVWDEGRRKSHIQTKIISAAIGKFGDRNFYNNVDPRVAMSTGRVFISLLSSVYWMFEFDVVAANNHIVEIMKQGNTFVDCKILFKDYMKTRQNVRTMQFIPL